MYFVTSTQLDKTDWFVFQIVGDDCLFQEYWPSPTFQAIFTIFVVFVEFIVPLIILVYCYGRILWIIRKRIESKMARGKTQTAKFELARNNVIKTLFIVVFFFFICYLGVEVLFISFNLGFKVDWNSSYYKFTVIMVFLNCTINPFIYLVNYKDFQKALIRQFRCRLSGHDCYSDRTVSTVFKTSVPSFNRYMREQ